MSNDELNSLYKGWVKEWMDHAQGLQSKAYYTYKKAYDSICKCPTPIIHPSLAKELEGIGEKMCQRFEEKMREHCITNNLPLPERPRKGRKRTNNSNSASLDFEEDGSSSAPAKPKKQKTYIPGFRTGGYAILNALLDISELGQSEATKEQICGRGQQYCDNSLTQADPGSSYTAFNSMKTLVEKSYVYKRGVPAKYCLTETGVEITKLMRQQESGLNVNDAERGSNSDSISTTAVVNPSTARGRKRGRGTSTLDILGSMIDLDSNIDLQPDMSLYVMNPSQYQTISVNGQTSTNNGSSTPTTRSNEMDNPNFLYALAESSRQSNGRAPKRNYTKKNKKTSTSSILDNLLSDFGDSLNGPDMSHYVLNPSAHSTITLNGRTTTATTTTSKPVTSLPASPISRLGRSLSANSNPSQPSRSGNASSITSSNMSSFARRVQSMSDDNNYDRLEVMPSSPSSSNPYRTPPNSKILQDDGLDRAIRESLKEANNTNKKNNVNNKPSAPLKTNKKPAYNVDDFELDLTQSTMPELNNSLSNLSQINDIPTEDIVDLLSSLESSPELRPTSSSNNIAKQLNNSKKTIEDFPFLSDEDLDFDIDVDYFPMSQAQSQATVDDTFHYTYLDTSNNPVRQVTSAAITIDRENSDLAYKIRFFSKQSAHPFAKNLIQTATDDHFAECRIAYLPEQYMTAICPGLSSAPASPLHREELDGFWLNENNSQSVQNTAPSSQMSDYSQISIPSSQSSIATSSAPSYRKVNNSSLSSQTLAFCGDKTPLSSSQQTAATEQETDYAELIESEPTKYTLLPSEYEIVLVLDSREIQMQQNRQAFQEKLAKKGVNYVTRSLDLGDVIWIARKKGCTNQSDELFLDYILERKRLDDLITSIKDGRFTEQKTRLKRSGASKLLYLVEEYNQVEAAKFGLQMLQTAMSSTQIIDGIYLKRTNNADETVEYLSSITRLIQRVYKGKTLHSIPGHIITRRNYVELKDAYREKSKQEGDKAAFLISYPLYGQLNTKNGSTSLQDIYLRMLMTIRGVNAERALSLTKAFPTPRSLLEMMEGKSLEQVKSLLSAATAGQISRRRWGTSISEKLYEIWSAIDYSDNNSRNIFGDED